MDGSSPRSDANGRHEPAGMTLADLGFLIVGAALALALPWYARGAWEAQTLGAGPAPLWYGLMFIAREAIQKACLALLPAVLARRVRYGGPPRPAELLLAACVAPLLQAAAESWPGMRRLEQDPSTPGLLSVVPTAAYWWWKGSCVAVFVGALVTLVAARRRLSGGAQTILLVVAGLGFYCGTLDAIDQGVDRIVARLPASELTQECLGFLLAGPLRYLFFGVLTAAAILRLWRPRDVPRTWLEWAGPALAGTQFVNNSTLYTAVDSLTTPPSVQWAVWILASVVMLVSVVISLFVVRRLGPAWGRWLVPAGAGSAAA